MEIVKKGVAGTMQSSDLMVFVEPADSLKVEIESTVIKQFGHLIQAKVDEVLVKNNVTRGFIRLTDRGALDYAIEARIETALQRASAARA
ncbi:MAG: citrate lyase acyl carrier protein [Candidatus Accumulibacter sp.]|jgi:citrate lyase subunit gamma (acyl carrier protein)|nr:citrate lyase acyl carrier protein [Accumulibacter sp.]